MVNILNKPTEAQFEDYVAIRNSGITNMFDVNRVTKLSTTGLTVFNCYYIMENFEALAKEYGVEI